MHLCQAIYTFLVYVLSFDDMLYLLFVSNSPVLYSQIPTLYIQSFLFHIRTARKIEKKKGMKVPRKQPGHLYHGNDCSVSKQRETKQS